MYAVGFGLIVDAGPVCGFCMSICYLGNDRLQFRKPFRPDPLSLTAELDRTVGRKVGRPQGNVFS